MKIAVLFGGNSPERAVSLSSGLGIASALLKRGHRVALLDPADPLGAGWLCREEELPTVKEAPSIPSGGMGLLALLPMLREADVAFLALHGGWGEDGGVQAFLELFGIPYTGSKRVASAIAMDKALSKRLLCEAGIATARWRCFAGEVPSAKTVAEQIGFPCVVKPITGGSSIGVSIVRTREELPDVCASVARDVAYMIEAFLSGRELSVGFLGERLLPPVEILAHGAFYDYESKYAEHGAEELCPAPLTPEENAAVGETVRAVISALGLSGYGRVDLILTERGIPTVLEANTLPGMTKTSILPRAAAAVGIEYGALCEQIAEGAL